VFKFKQYQNRMLPGYSILQTQSEPMNTSLALLFCQDDDNGVIVRTLLDNNKMSFL